MADFNSSLPVRTETAGDVIVKVADSLIPSQQVQITADREMSVLSTAQPGVDIGDVTVNNGSGGAAVNIQDGGNSITVDATDLDIRDLSSATDSVTVVATDLDIRDLDSASDSVTVIQGTSPWVTTVSSFPTTVDTDYGVVGASTLRTAAQIGSATGAADFGAGATGAQTLRVEANQGAASATPWKQDIAQIAGSAPSASNSLPVQLTDGTDFYDDTNPVPVKFAQEGTQVNDFKDASSIAAGASDSHDYTAVGDFILNQVEASASGKAKMAVQIETGVSTNTFSTYFVKFNSTAETNMSLVFSDPIPVAAGVRVRVVMSNRDLQAQDLYSTICGLET